MGKIQFCMFLIAFVINSLFCFGWFAYESFTYFWSLFKIEIWFHVVLVVSCVIKKLSLINIMYYIIFIQSDAK